MEEIDIKTKQESTHEWRRITVVFLLALLSIPLLSKLTFNLMQPSFIGKWSQVNKSIWFVKSSRDHEAADLPITHIIITIEPGLSLGSGSIAFMFDAARMPLHDLTLSSYPILIGPSYIYIPFRWRLLRNGALDFELELNRANIPTFLMSRLPGYIAYQFLVSSNRRKLTFSYNTTRSLTHDQIEFVRTDESR